MIYIIEHMKKYFKGYYCVNREEIETIGKNSNRIIIDILKDILYLL
jgi:hypothetical protein